MKNVIELIIFMCPENIIVPSRNSKVGSHWYTLLYMGFFLSIFFHFPPSFFKSVYTILASIYGVYG